jgi:thiamine biosynthesis protein ThiS
MSIEITLNGKLRTLPTSLTIESLFTTLELDPTHRIVEVNGEIYNKDAFSSVTLKNNDSVEIIQFMGGGSGISHSL